MHGITALVLRIAKKRAGKREDGRVILLKLKTVVHHGQNQDGHKIKQKIVFGLFEHISKECILTVFQLYPKTAINDIFNHKI